MSDDKRSRNELVRELDPELGEVSEEELAESSRLAEALAKPSHETAGKQGPNALADLATSLRHAHSPKEIPKDAHEKIIAATLAERSTAQDRGRVIRVAFGVTAFVAIAAALIFFLTKPKAPDQVPTASLVRSRSTASLFHEPFKSTNAKSATARIDRIAGARERDYRENMFALATTTKARGAR